jgi:DNA-3-methyladenine glycosylase
MRKLPVSFYRRADVVEIARDLLGKIIVTKFNGVTTTGRIMETEAYNGIHDKASHAYGGRRTARTDVMYADGGVAYVYLIYGLHHLFNVVTNVKGVPHAVLIRAIATSDNRMIIGPGKVSTYLGITVAHTGHSLNSKEFYIADDGHAIDASRIIAGPRINVAYAMEDALLRYRFVIETSFLNPTPARHTDSNQ